MALLSLNSNSTHGFNAVVEIDQTLFSYNKFFTTETQTVDGMPDVRWHLKVYPVDPQDKNMFGIYMCLQSDKEIEYVIYGRKGSHDCGFKEFPIKQENHTSLFNPRCQCIVNGKYKLNIPGTFSYKSKVANNILKICNPYEWGFRLEQNSVEDFEIHVDGEIFQIHQFIIAAESPVFKQMFESDFKEAVEKKVFISDFGFHVVDAFIDFCYGRDISESFKFAIDLLHFADKYDCQTLKQPIKQIPFNFRQACIEFVRKILYSRDSFTDEEMDSFDIKFVKEVFALSNPK
uniref:BTB domain-containing protein n=1 Tax=Panagrolaimus superbus TaxID=310955 RepID=A0A914Z736_9BILA